MLRKFVAEIIGYILDYDNAADFRKSGTKTWDANANENQAWLNNPYRKGLDDCGFIYGKVARNFPKPDGGAVDLLKQILDDLSKGRDNRGEILIFWLKLPPQPLPVQ
jgi:thymidylate synthase